MNLEARADSNNDCLKTANILDKKNQEVNKISGINKFGKAISIDGSSEVHLVINARER